MNSLPRKAVIPAAGLGTRLLPETFAVPKELLPIIGGRAGKAVLRPVLHLVVEEAARAGATDIVLVTSPGKEGIASYFRHPGRLTRRLAGTRQADLLYPLVSLQRRVRIRAVVQREPKGLGHAILCARKAIGKEPFAVLLPDEIFDGETSPTEELLEVAASNPGAALAAVVRVSRSETRRYGIVDARRQGDFFKVRRAVEKPEPAKAPSSIALVGRYILPPDVFDLLAATRDRDRHELHLTGVLDTLARQGRFFVLPTQCQRFDTGNPKGWLSANVHFGRRILGKI